MGLFNFFKRKQPDWPAGTALPSPLTAQGPMYLRPYLTLLEEDMKSFYKIRYPNVEWIGQLVSSTGNRWFTIKYYGELLDKATIVNANLRQWPMKVVAVDDQSGEEIVLFDKAVHGFEGFIAHEYKETMPASRPVDKEYPFANAGLSFKIVFVAFYNSTEEHLSEYLNDDGLVEVPEGIGPISLADACPDAFDALGVYVIGKNGKRTEMISEELM